MSKDRGTRSLSISPAIAAGQPRENAGRIPVNAGTSTGPGDEFGYLPSPGQGFQYPVQVAWDVTVSGGTLSALTVALEVSDDGTNWFQLDSQNSVTGGRKVVQNTVGGKILRANITTYTVATGTPVVTVGITC
jgi:hypothetical protein